MGASCCSTEIKEKDCCEPKEFVTGCSICDETIDTMIATIHSILDDVESRKDAKGSLVSQKMNMLRNRLYEMYWVP